MTQTQPNVFWITGLSGAGKSTTAQALIAHLKEQGRSPIFLDGDELRAIMDAIHAHTREERIELASRYGRLCKFLADQGLDVVIATISMYDPVYAWNRAHIPGYIEIFLDVPLEELRKRDPKDIYKRADRGLLKDVAGLDLRVDIPPTPDIHYRWSPESSAHNAAEFIIDTLRTIEHHKNTQIMDNG
ncbi:MAG: adenylyl-sulfate kinase [Alphaproteobacteria bacterium]|nr:adenylyl-sulfate kinase [Alphaproteobacteria bacterium]